MTFVKEIAYVNYLNVIFPRFATNLFLVKLSVVEL